MLAVTVKPRQKKKMDQQRLFLKVILGNHTTTFLEENLTMGELLSQKKGVPIG